ncbi:hypothetical protein FLJC2902T_32390 [Flavobacterium limnosediminis JC2902]|uniref:Uncharacterized protein n=1 Tax=Flavobacterium limnosediminis JC2902 TaxID=1341181 RepID=V6SEU7_9FLAO|nr:hypothetical protein [Flavobacterium limnosediminis]ESU22940.1 hypothetical protein FLJC2902T_32390 [Flavobacterium limnosediminis JC2902]
MSKLNEISDSLTTTLKEGELHKVSLDVLETVGDSLLKDGILKDIPVLGAVFGVSKGIMNVRDILFAKKLLLFLKELSAVSKDDRLKQIEKIENSNEYKTKVGEKLLYLVERCEDPLKAQIVGKLFCSFLDEKITYLEFLKCSNAVQNLFTSDINEFIKYQSEKLQIELASQYISVGLMDIVFQPPKMVDKSRLYGKQSGTKIDLSPGNTFAKLSPIGFALKRALN